MTLQLKLLKIFVSVGPAYKKLKCSLHLLTSVTSLLYELRSTEWRFCLRFTLCRDFTQRRKVIPYRRFGITCMSHLQGSNSPRHRDGSLKSHIEINVLGVVFILCMLLVHNYNMAA